MRTCFVTEKQPGSEANRLGSNEHSHALRLFRHPWISANTGTAYLRSQWPHRIAHDALDLVLNRFLSGIAARWSRIASPTSPTTYARSIIPSALCDQGRNGWVPAPSSVRLCQSHMYDVFPSHLAEDLSRDRSESAGWTKPDKGMQVPDSSPRSCRSCALRTRQHVCTKLCQTRPIRQRLGFWDTGGSEFPFNGC